MITKDKLIHGLYYKGFSRFALYARWDSEIEYFRYWNDEVIDFTKHIQDELPQWDAFTPMELTEQKRIIPLVWV